MTQRPQRNSANLLRQIQSENSKLAELSDPQLRRYVDDLRYQAQLNDTKQESLIVPAVAASQQAILRVLGYTLYDVQQRAALAVIQNCVAEMQTGEGKTVSAVPAAVFAGILGKGTHVATPNNYLAERDYEQLKPVYEILGLEVGLTDLDATNSEAKRAGYRADITYGPGYEFGFDYLRDQLLLKKQANLPIGQRTLDRLSGNDIEEPVLSGRLGFAIIDEIDNVLIDDSSSPQVLSEFQSGEAPDRHAVQLAYQIALRLWENEHYFETANGTYTLTQQGVSLIHDPSIIIPAQQLIRPWRQYVENALKAMHVFKKDEHYVVQNDEVRIVEQSTGRIFEDRSWQSGLHQAVEAKEGLTITPESLPLAQITRQRFFHLYQHLAGMTGTATQCRAELKQVYNLDVVEIPLRIPSKRIVLPVQTYAHAMEKWEAIAKSAQEYQAAGRPVLIGTRTIVESQIVTDILKPKGISHLLLNGKQDATEAEIISEAAYPGRITIATNLAGRGTDIKLTAESKAAGGLHVIVSECHASNRVDRQLVGRCARQGDPGSCQTFISADDWLFTKYAPWFSDSLHWATRNNVEIPNLPKRIRKIQDAIEREQFASRLQLLEQSDKKRKLLAR